MKFVAKWMELEKYTEGGNPVHSLGSMFEECCSMNLKSS